MSCCSTWAKILTAKACTKLPDARRASYYLHLLRTPSRPFEDGAENFDEMVVQLGVPFWSSCEHHLLPFWGVAHVGYIPSNRILGLSKISRLIDVFARRLTVQERLTTSIAQALMDGLEARGVGVVLQARHSCMESRGIQKAGTITVTSVMRGVFRDKPETRAEFLALVNHAVGGQTL